MNMITDMTTSRRQFLSAGGGLIFGLTLSSGARAAAAFAGGAGTLAPNAFVRVGTDNLVTIVIKHVDFGQGQVTGLATILADELDASWDQVRAIMAPADDALYKNLQFGTMGTGGSTGTANSWMQMRNAGASARTMLVQAAALKWGAPASTISVRDGVAKAAGKSATFGELAEAASKLTPPAKPTLKSPDQWRLIGRTLPKLDTFDKTVGKTIFTQDVKRDGLLYSAIQHPPLFGAKVRSVDDRAARAVPGVVDVKTIPQGVIVYAKDTYAALKGRQALAIEWDSTAAEKRSSDQIYAAHAALARQPGNEVEREGDAAAALKSAAKSIEAEYRFPFLAHAPMETLDAVLHKDGDQLHVWMGSQFQAAELATIAGVNGVPVENAQLHQLFAGGSFGRRGEPHMTFATEAGHVLKAIGAGPVKHVWTRENDIRGGLYRPLTVHRLRGGVDAAGNISVWDQVVVAQSIFKGTVFEKAMFDGPIDKSLTEGASEGDYRFPNMRIGQHVVDGVVPPLWWRSVGHTHTAYAVECFLDELLELGGKDAVAGRRSLMKETRQQAVLDRVASMADWGRKPADGHAFGVAAHKSFGTNVAQIVDISRGKDGRPKVHKVWCAVDCGVAVNPDIVRAQVEGAVGYGLGAALYSEIVLGPGGQVQQNNFDDYKPLRMRDMPAVEVAIMPSTVDPTGIGEPGLPPLAPAVANAWRRLTGVSVRQLPFKGDWS